jgi:hypothetical protein
LRDRINSCENGLDESCTKFCEESGNMKAVSFNTDKVIKRVQQGGNEIVVLFGNMEFRPSGLVTICQWKVTVFEEYMGHFNKDKKELRSEIKVKNNHANFSFVEDYERIHPLIRKKKQYCKEMSRRSNLYVIHDITCGEKIGHLTVVSMADPYMPKDVAVELFKTPYKKMFGPNIEAKDNTKKDEAFEFFKESYFIYESLNLMKMSVRDCKIGKQDDWADELTGRLTDDTNSPLTKQIFDALKKLGNNPKFTFVFPQGQFETMKESLRKKC